MASQAGAAWQPSRITSSDASVAGVVLERLDLQGLLEITKPSKIDVLVVRKVDLIKARLGDERCLLDTRASACRTRTSEQVMGRAVRRSEAHDMVKGKRYAEPLRADKTAVTTQQHAGAYSMACAGLMHCSLKGDGQPMPVAHAQVKAAKGRRRCSGEEVCAGFETTEGGRESNRKISGR